MFNLTYGDWLETLIFVLLLVWFVMDRSHAYFRDEPEEGDNDWGLP